MEKIKKLAKKLTFADYAKGFVVGGLTSIIFFFQDWADSGVFHIDVKKAAMAFIGGGVGYLIKNLLTLKDEGN